jgi:hypothetical protein
LEFKNRKRPLLQPGRYTELFFLDEATALAAGHRPCMECRRDDAKRFLALAGFKTVTELDAQLETERFGETPSVTNLSDYPDGTFVHNLAVPYTILGGELYEWCFDGYKLSPEAPKELVLLTPSTTVEVLRRGYQPQIYTVRFT